MSVQTKIWKELLLYSLSSSILIASPLILANSPEGTATIHAVHYEKLSDKYRLLLETDRDIEFQVISEINTDKVIIELKDVNENNITEVLAKAISSPHPLIQNIEIQTVHHVVRLQLILNKKIIAKVFKFQSPDSNNHQLILDLSPHLETENGLLINEKLTHSLKSPAVSVLPIEPSLKDAELEQTATREFEELWLETMLNNQVQRNTLFTLRDGNGDILLSERDLTAWQLLLPESGTLDYQGEQFYYLKDLGIQAEIDLRRLTMDILAPTKLFKATTLEGGQQKRTALSPSSRGVFFNYDLSATQNSSDREIRSSGLFEVVAFNEWGSGSTNFLAQYNQVAESPEWIRLDSYWRKDDPNKMRTLILGDTYSRGTGWSGGVRFGGLQWGSNYSTQPEFVTLPLMSMAGEAALPSTVDLYINNALRLKREIPPGPFSIDDIPTVTGDGQAKLVVRDILGREKIITQDFYSSQQLLRMGLNEYSLEFGAIRENYGRSSNDYGRMMAAATWRRGLSNRFTLQTHAQALSDQGLLGLGTYSVLPWGGMLSLAAAASYRDDRRGEFFSLELQRQGNIFSFGLDKKIASTDFVRLGMIDGQSLPADQSRVYASIKGLGSGSLNVNYTSQQYSDENKIDFFTVAYNFRVLDIGFMQLSAIHFLDKSDTTLRAAITLPLSTRMRTNLNLGATHMRDRNESFIQVQRSLPVGTGYGYNLRVGMGESKQQQGSLSYQNNYTTYQLEASHLNEQTGVRANVRGGAALIGGTLLPSRYIDNSFAIIKIPDFANVRIYAENQEVARTNSKGEALIPRLRPYERNQIRVEQSDLPLDAKIKSLAMDVYPYYRSGVMLNFPVTSTREAFFSLVWEDGSPLPIGAIVTNEKNEHFPVGMRGEVFLTDLEKVNQLKATWKDQSCKFTVNVSDSNTLISEPSEIVCYSNSF